MRLGRQPDARLVQGVAAALLSPSVLSIIGVDIVLPLRLAHPRGELRFLSTVSTFGTANDVTLAELAIEAFYPADTDRATRLLGGLKAR